MVGLLSPQMRVGGIPGLQQVEYPGIQYDYNMGPGRPYRPAEPILDLLGEAASNIFGPGSRISIGSGSTVDYTGSGPTLPRVGSNRHETGTAADHTVYRPDGSVVTTDSEDGRRYALEAARLGATGIGFGPEYMGNAFHIDQVEPGQGQGNFWASGASSIGNELVAAMNGNVGVPGGTSRSAQVARPTGNAQTITRSGQEASTMPGQTQGQERLPFGQRLRENFRNGSAWDSLAIGLNGMTLNPNIGMQGMIQDRMEGRREDARLNQTAEWLRSVGRGDLADAVMAGGLTGGAAGGIAMTPEPSGPSAPETSAWLRGNGFESFADMVDRGLITPADALSQAMAQPDQTSGIENYEYLIANGVSPADAQGMAFGGGGTVINNQVGPDGTQLPNPATGFVYARDAQGNVIMEGYTLPNGGVASRPRQIPIAGSGADTDAVAAAEQAGAADATTAMTAGVVLEDIDRIQEIVNESTIPITGAIGGLMSFIPGTNSYDVSQLATTIRANIGFDRLQRMRAESPTGGALGNVTVQELARLESVLGSLDQGQSQEQFLRNFQRLEGLYVDIMDRVDPAFAAEMGYAQGGQASGQLQSPVERPESVDPAVWDVLSPEDRELFR